MIDELFIETMMRLGNDPEFIHRIIEPLFGPIIIDAEDGEDYIAMYPSKISGRFGGMTMKTPSREVAWKLWKEFSQPNERKYSIRKVMIV